MVLRKSAAVINWIHYNKLIVSITRNNQDDALSIQESRGPKVGVTVCRIVVRGVEITGNLLPAVLNFFILNYSKWMLGVSPFRPFNPSYQRGINASCLKAISAKFLVVNL